MIVERKLGDALDATENFLLVPAPVGREEGFYEGFISQVFEAFPEAEEHIRQVHGVKAGGIELIGRRSARDRSWLPVYTLVLAGIHYPDTSGNGWNESPDLLRIAMDQIKRVALQDDIKNIKLATAGIPGTGYGEVGSKRGVEVALDNHPLAVVIYSRRNEQKGQTRRASTPRQTSGTIIPKAYAERHPFFSHTL